MRYQKRKRNTPISTLIKNYVNKKSSKVSVSREEIKWRFDHLDWKDQKKILFAFMDSGISDREWAYSKMLDNWDDSFQPKVRELWETYHEYKCSWSIIRYFPLEYIKEHIGEFTDERDYYFICLRLAKDKDYVIDRTKLSDRDYLAVLCHTGHTISDDEARDTLFSIIHNCCLADTFMPRLERVGEGRYDKVITPANYREVNLAIYYLLKLEKDNIVLFSQVINGQAEFLEISAERGMPLTEKTLTELDIPQGVLIAAVHRKGEIITPRGDTRIQPGDRVIILAMLSSAAELEGLLKR